MTCGAGWSGSAASTTVCRDSHTPAEHTGLGLAGDPVVEQSPGLFLDRWQVHYLKVTEDLKGSIFVTRVVCRRSHGRFHFYTETRAALVSHVGGNKQ